MIKRYGKDKLNKYNIGLFPLPYDFAAHKFLEHRTVQDMSSALYKVP